MIYDIYIYIYIYIYHTIQRTNYNPYFNYLLTTLLHTYPNFASQYIFTTIHRARCTCTCTANISLRLIYRLEKTDYSEYTISITDL